MRVTCHYPVQIVRLSRSERSLKLGNLGDVVTDNTDALAMYESVTGYRLYRLEEGESKFVYEGDAHVT